MLKEVAFVLAQEKLGSFCIKSYNCASDSGKIGSLGKPGYPRTRAHEYTRRLKLGSIGFVFLEAGGDFICITLCLKGSCVRSWPRKIGFVLHKKL